ncbi:MAG: hypothetical protein JW748_11175 [Anaerolineales bacterium]|nr:hypothetical protein [Anaerolineales bacterium]
MTFMLLDVEAVSDVQDRMVKKQAHVMERISAMAGAVQGLEEGAWVGYSATQFFQEYYAWNTAWKLEMDLLRALADRMKQEINEWQEAAARLG